MTEKRLKVVVIGGGIGGLFAANALVAHGFQVSVYEQAPNLGEVGAGVFLTPNSVRQLQRVGLGQAVEKFGARVGFGSQYLRHNGVPIAPVQVTRLGGLERRVRNAPRRPCRNLSHRPAKGRGAHWPPLHRL